MTDAEWSRDDLLRENRQLRDAYADAKRMAADAIQTYQGRTAHQWAMYATDAEARELALRAQLDAIADILKRTR